MLVQSLSAVRAVSMREQGDLTAMQDATTRLAQAKGPVAVLSARSEFAAAQNDVQRQAGSVLNIVA